MYLAVDVGGTKTLLAIFEEAGSEPVKEVQFPTPETYEQFLEDFKRHVSELDVDQFTATAIAIPGEINREKGIGLLYGNLSWTNNSVQSDLSKMLRCPVFLENDAKAGALIEAKYIINDFKSILYLTIGTGIGIAVVRNGVNDYSVADLGGAAFMVDHEGKKQAWEKFAGGKAIFRTYGKKAAEITDEKTWKQIVDNFMTGILPLCKQYKPEAIVFGGGVGVHFDRFKDLLAEELKILPNPPALIQARHTKEAVVYGCIELIKQNHG